MTTRELKKLKIKFFKDYYIKDLSTKDISKKYNIKKGTVNYHLHKFKMSKLDYLDRTITKDQILSKISNYTYKESAEKMGIPLARFRKLLLRKNIKRTPKDFIVNSIKSDFYLNKPLIFYYYLGLVASDGYIRKNSVRITIKNKGTRDLFSKLSLFTNYKGTISERNDYYEITFTDEKLVQELELLGVPKINKTENLKIPNVDLTKEQFLNYFCGLFDGDGNFNKISSVVKLVNYSKTFIEDLAKMFSRILNIQAKVGKYDSSVYTLYFSAKDSRFLLREMYGNCPLYLECKYNSFKEFYIKYNPLQ